jgi:hypothetical protein
MTMQRLPDGSVRISALDDWHLNALRRIPSLADPGDDEKALRRIYPAPYTAGEATQEQQEDWAEYVQPELESLFATSIQRMAADLQTAHLSVPPPEPPAEDAPAPNAGAGAGKNTRKRLKPKVDTAPEWSISIPADHIEDWFRAMNQARLVLSASKEAHRHDDAHVAAMLLKGELDLLIQYELLTGMCDWWVGALLSQM